jgi:hypothetical protein
LRALDALLWAATKEAGKGKSARDVSVDAVDGAEYPGNDLVAVIEEAQQDVREIKVVWVGYRITFVGHIATLYADVGDRTVSIRLHSEDEGWVRKVEDRINRTWAQWDRDATSPGAGVTIAATTVVGHAGAGGGSGTESSLGSSPTVASTSGAPASRWTKANKVWVGIGAVVAFLAGIATIIQTFK